jgi:hypothetical protein
MADRPMKEVKQVLKMKPKDGYTMVTVILECWHRQTTLAPGPAVGQKVECYECRPD